MGYTRAIDMAVAAHNGVIGRQTALMDHFTINMYPAVPLVMIEAAEQAIDAVVAGEPSTMIDLPASLAIQRDGRLVRQMPANVLVETLRLEVYVEVSKHA